MDIIQEAKEELSVMRSAIDLRGYLHIDKEKAERLESIFSRLVDMLEWRPIESAPKDGTEILLFFPFDEQVCIGYWEKAFTGAGDARWAAKDSGDRLDFIRDYPAHWLPLPPVGDK